MEEAQTMAERRTGGGGEQSATHETGMQGHATAREGRVQSSETTRHDSGTASR